MSSSPPQGASTSPQHTLKRRFRTIETFKLNNSTGSGDNQYAFYSTYKRFNPLDAVGFRDAARTFELFKVVRAKVWIQMGYNPYNSTYSTVSLDAALATTVWTAADFGNNESVSGTDIMCYDNARFHSISLNKFHQLINSGVRINNDNITAKSILPNSTWLDTATFNNDAGGTTLSGYHLFARMPGVTGTNWMPQYQLITEYTVEFKQPAWQNMASTFETEIMSATLDCQIDAQGTRRMYVMNRLTREATGLEYHFVREDGLPGSLTYEAEDMFEMYKTGHNVGYFSDADVIYTGPAPLKH